MNYLEAEEKQKQIGPTYEQDGIVFKVIVGPSNPKDFQTFMSDFRFIPLENYDAKAYSMDGTYEVYGLFTNGKDVIYKKLTHL